MGRLAQLVEHLVYTERVSGSSPLAPTRFVILSFIRQKASGAQSAAMRGKRNFVKCVAIALAMPAFASPAFATHAPVLFKTAKAQPILLAKERADRESSADNKQLLCRPAIKPMSEGRVNRSTNCPKPRPILM